MFLYWDGFEIDGSDTDFDIVLPETKELAAFVDCFLSIPLFGDQKPELYFYSKRNQKEIMKGKSQLMELLTKEQRPDISIDINCLSMDELPEEVQQRLYGLSEKREPHEEAYGKVENPCMAPTSQKYHTGGEMTVSLTIEAEGTKRSWYTEDGAVLEGYVYNEPLMRSADDHPCFSINVGPSFYYEYAIYMMEYLRDHFPGLGTAGGLDCANGWTFGCTYADSIYSYEKIQMPVKYSVRNTVKRLSEYDILCSYRHYYKKKWHYDRISQFRLANKLKQSSQEQECLPFSEYVSHVEKVLAESKDTYEAICKTAVHIMLPEPARFEKEPKAKEMLTKALEGVENAEAEWNYTGYIAFAMKEGQLVCEFRIHWRLKNYFLALMDLVDSGAIEGIKTETYERRHQDDR